MRWPHHPVRRRRRRRALPRRGAGDRPGDPLRGLRRRDDGGARSRERLRSRRAGDPGIRPLRRGRASRRLGHSPLAPGPARGPAVPATAHRHDGPVGVRRLRRGRRAGAGRAVARPLGGIFIVAGLGARRIARRPPEEGIRVRQGGAALAAGVVIGFSQAVPMLALPAFFTAVQGIDGFFANFLLAPFVVAVFVAGPASGWLLARYSPRVLIIGGVLAIAAGDRGSPQRSGDRGRRPARHDAGRPRTLGCPRSRSAGGVIPPADSQGGRCRRCGRWDPRVRAPRAGRPGPDRLGPPRRTSSPRVGATATGRGPAAGPVEAACARLPARVHYQIFARRSPARTIGASSGIPNATANEGVFESGPFTRCCDGEWVSTLASIRAAASV